MEQLPGEQLAARQGFPRRHAPLKLYLDAMPACPSETFGPTFHRINSRPKSALGYPTQKPEALLERIIKASSNEGDMVLDPFCGCGTAIAVAERLKRRWIGIDITYLAINLVQRRLRDTFGEQLSPYEIVGAPTDVQGAEALKEISPHQFEWWAVDLVNARPAKDHKKGADTGIDGYINFFDDKSGQAKQVIVQVKSGYIGVNHVRDLKGVLDREKAAIGALITLARAHQAHAHGSRRHGLLRVKRLSGPLSPPANPHHRRIAGGKEARIPRPPRRNLRQSGAEDQDRAGGSFLVGGAQWACPLRVDLHPEAGRNFDEKAEGLLPLVSVVPVVGKATEAGFRPDVYVARSFYPTKGKLYGEIETAFRDYRGRNQVRSLTMMGGPLVSSGQGLQGSGSPRHTAAASGQNSTPTSASAA